MNAKPLQAAVELLSQPNILTPALQFSVFIKDDLKSHLIYSRDDVIYQQGGDTFVVNNYRHLHH